MAKRRTEQIAPDLTPTTAALSDLRPHPRNYRVHPDDQLDHLARSITEHGLYRNVVVAQDGTILAGHGVALAAERLGMKTIPVIRLPIEPDSPAALKVLTGDNEIEHLADQDDRLLSEILREIKQEAEAGLLGTGYDEAMLANLVMVTRPASEIADFNEAAAWVGMPSYDDGGERTFKLVVSFVTEADRERFVRQKDLRIDKREAGTWTTRWPFTEREEPAALRFQEEALA